VLGPWVSRPWLTPWRPSSCRPGRAVPDIRDLHHIFPDLNVTTLLVALNGIFAAGLIGIGASPGVRLPLVDTRHLMVTMLLLVKDIELGVGH